MSNVVCLSTNYLLIIFCIFVGFALIYKHFDKEKHIINDPNYVFEDRILNKVVKKINESNTIDRRLYLNMRDRSVLDDDFVPPERRVPEYLYPFGYVKNQLNIPTRGYPENYQILGVLLRENTETSYNLFGRQTYPGSNLWEYYCENDKFNNVKLPIKIRGDKEIMDGDDVHVPGTDHKNGKFRVKLYKFDVPRYIPVI